MIKEIPVRSDILAYKFSIDIDGTIYTFEFFWNDRASTWVWNIRSEAGDAIVLGIPIRLGVLLTNKYKDTRLPLGEFFAIDISGGWNEACVDDFGSRVLLFYRSGAE